MRVLSLAIAIGAAGCAAPVAGPVPPPAVWRVVDVAGPRGRRLLLEREAPRVEVRLLRERAQVGEIVEAEVRLPGGEGRRRIQVRPSRPDVTIHGPAAFEVDGEAPVRVRFTGASAGKGGIVVVAEE